MISLKPNNSTLSNSSTTILLNKFFQKKKLFCSSKNWVRKIDLKELSKKRLWTNPSQYLIRSEVSYFLQYQSCCPCVEILHGGHTWHAGVEDQGGVTSSWVELLHTFSGAWDAWVGGWYEVHRWGTHYILGRVENQKSWKITKPQVDPIDAHKNKTMCTI